LSDFVNFDGAFKPRKSTNQRRYKSKVRGGDHPSKRLLETRIMTRPLRFTAIIEREDEGFMSLCPELDIASKNCSIEAARADLVEALFLFFEIADPSEIARRFRSEVFITQVEVPVG
jgi:predicted RNase H-like HicB family nuclease